MIFTYVLILILSIVVSGHYESVFRSAAFVVSIVLIRFALTEGYPYGAPLAILAMVFGISVLLVFNYHMRIHENSAHG
jgi:archaellum biogenesis protein FlaJ (TadC family)